MSDAEKSYIVDLTSTASAIVRDDINACKFESAFSKLKKHCKRSLEVMMVDYMRARVDEVLVDPLHVRFNTGVRVRMDDFRVKYDMQSEKHFNTIRRLFESLPSWQEQERKLKVVGQNEWNVWEHNQTVHGTYALVCRGDFRVLAFEQLTQDVKADDRLTLAIQVLTGHGKDEAEDSGLQSTGI